MYVRDKAKVSKHANALINTISTSGFIEPENMCTLVTFFTSLGTQSVVKFKQKNKDRLNFLCLKMNIYLHS